MNRTVLRLDRKARSKHEQVAFERLQRFADNNPGLTHLDGLSGGVSDIMGKKDYVIERNTPHHCTALYVVEKATPTVTVALLYIEYNDDYRVVPNEPNAASEKAYQEKPYAHDEEQPYFGARNANSSRQTKL